MDGRYPPVSTGRHRGRGRAKRPRTGYETLDRSRRRRILRALISGVALAPADQPFARERASHAAAQLPQALGRGAFFGLLVVSPSWSLFPLTAGTTTMLVLLVVAVAIYLAGLGFALRMRWWLRRHC